MRDNLLGVLVIAFIAILVFSTSPWFGGTHLVISRLGDVVVPVETVGDATYAVESEGVHLPWPTSKAQDLLKIMAAARGVIKPAAYTHLTKPALGYMVREITLLGMPFGYYTDGGYALYTESDWGAVALPLGDAGVALLNRANHRDVTEAGLYPFWRHLWGWLFVAGVACWGWLHYRHLIREREEAGLI